MGSKETQALIISTALNLFNEYSSGAISTNRIAEHCGISKGNLHYHFKNKQEIILSIFRNIADEMNSGWYQDHLDPSVTHMAEMFVRQLRLIHDYRFFYREMPALLRSDPILLRRYQENRDKRLEALFEYFRELVKCGVMQFKDESNLNHLVVSTWIISDNWLNFIEFGQIEQSLEKVLGGYEIILEIMRPNFCGDWEGVKEESLATIRKMLESSTATESATS